MSLRVIGAGFGRTGTLSLKHALEQLGFTKCYHMLELMMHHQHHIPTWSEAHQGKPIDWDELYDGFQASVDWPACNLWREQFEHFPHAKVVLSMRDPDRWYDSVMETIYGLTVTDMNSGDPRRQKTATWLNSIIWDRVFDGRMDDRAHVISVFNQHNESVIASVPADKLLVFEAADGWKKLCSFLDVEIPDEPYPRVNSKDEFKEMVSKRPS